MSHFPTTPGAYQPETDGMDGFVVKIDAYGALVYSTGLGGTGIDSCEAIAIDAAGNAYVTGYTTSKDFPLTDGAYRGANTEIGDPPYNVFVTKLNSSGSGLIYSALLGGSSWDEGFGIAVDSTGNAYVTGYTWSNDFDITLNAFQTVGHRGDVFVTKLDPQGASLVYSTYLGMGEGRGITLLKPGNECVVTGYTSSMDFPLQNPFQEMFGGGLSDGFVATLNANGTALVSSTYLGGTYDDKAWAVAVDLSGNIYVIGETQSTDFPTRLDSFQPQFAGVPPTYDAFLAKLSPGEPDRMPPEITMIFPMENQVGVDVTSAPLTIQIQITDNDTGVYWNPSDPQWSVILKRDNILLSPSWNYDAETKTGVLTFTDDGTNFQPGQCYTGYVEARDIMKNVSVKWFYFNTAAATDPINSETEPVYLCPHPDWNATPPEEPQLMTMMTMSTLAAEATQCLPDTDGDGIPDTKENETTHTTLTKGTLYIKPTLMNRASDGTTSLSYWADFKAKHWAAVSVPFNKLNIELVVVGDPAAPLGANDYCAPAPYSKCLKDWDYDPYLDPTPPPISFVEVVYDTSPEPLSSTGASIQIHTNFSQTARNWYWGLLGMTPYEAVQGTNKSKYGYFKTYVYERPLLNYLAERQYSSLAKDSKRLLEVTTDNNCLSPLNKSNDATIEIYPAGGYCYDQNGTITATPTKAPAVYTFEKVLQRVIAHEIVHTLLNASTGDHCTCTTCLMYGAILNWNMADIGPKACGVHAPGKIYDIRPRVKNAINPAYVPAQ
jgi:hypothetical protein